MGKATQIVLKQQFKRARADVNLIDRVVELTMRVRPLRLVERKVRVRHVQIANLRDRLQKLCDMARLLILTALPISSIFFCIL